MTAAASVFSEHCGYHLFGTIDLDIVQRHGDQIVAERRGRDSTIR